MVQTAESRHRNHSTTGICNLDSLASSRRLLIRREMRSGVVIVADVFGHQPFQMVFIQDDDMIEEISPAIADEAFSDSILARATGAGAFRLETEALHRIADHFFAWDIR